VPLIQRFSIIIEGTNEI